VPCAGAGGGLLGGPCTPLASSGLLPPPPATLPSAAPGAGAGAPPPARLGGGALREGECLLRLPFTLELEAAPLKGGPERHPHLRIELLGPPAAVQGEPVALTWQLTRVADAPGVSSGGGGGDDWEDADEVLWYEVQFPPGSGLAPSAAGSRGGALSSGDWETSAARFSGGGGGGSCGGGGGSGAAARRQGCVRLGRRAGSVATVEACVAAVGAGLQEAPRLVLLGVPESEREQPDAGIFVAAA
jgi:hypothetical protein